MGMFFGNRFFGQDTVPMRRASIWGYRPLVDGGPGTVVSCCAQSENPVNPNYVTPCCAAQYWGDKRPVNILGSIFSRPHAIIHEPL